MATLYIAEYSRIASDANGNQQMPYDPPLTEQTLSIAGSPAQSAPFQKATRFLRLNTDAACSIEIGPDPTAALTSGRMSPNQTEYRAVVAGAGLKISVIANT